MYETILAGMKRVNKTLLYLLFAEMIFGYGAWIVTGIWR